MANHYDTLKVSRDASLERCKKAYREIQLANHPDKTKHLPEVQRANSEAISKAANVAYEILSDPTRRYMYDEIQAPIPGPVPQPQRAPNQRPPTPPRSPPNRHPKYTSRSQITTLIIHLTPELIIRLVNLR
jgi:curved DNA-binding protein CbpA